jgi:4-amino-4-deoxy-L-arabinose transferase-like glycosyltransferase
VVGVDSFPYRLLRGNRFMSEHLVIVPLLGSLVILASIIDRPHVWRVVMGGLLLGLAILTRGYLLFALPLMFLVLLLQFGRDRWKLSVAFAGASCIFVVLWVARNLGAVGKPVFSTQAEAFYLRNNDWTRGSIVADFNFMGTLTIGPERSRSEVERSQMWSREAKADIVGDRKRMV